VKADDAQGTSRRCAELLLGSFRGTGAETARLMTPGTDGVDADHMEAVCRVHGFRRPPLPLELAPRSGEATGWPERDVVVPRYREHGGRQASQERCHPVVLVGPATVCEVARGHHEIGLNTVHEGSQRALDEGLLARSDVDVGDVDQASWHSRGRLYTGLVPDESTESTELFDDLYLGLRAGGAMRKQRRGEPLTMEEEAALGHWQRLSRWRKIIAVGAFALGTFGLGFTIGGLIFGRRRKANA